ncbi:hypothetical protein GCM10028808_56100 [Spirosoma migulaei]
MQSIIRFRFIWFALLISTTLFTSCKKSSVDPQPADLADRVAGTYTYSAFTMNGQTRPASETNLTGKVRVSRETANSVQVAFAITQKNCNPFLDSKIAI